MALSEEEKKKIYEEEKARIEAREQLEGGKQTAEGKTGTTGMDQNVAGLLCYLAGWLTGLIFLLVEKENKFVRFHAMQSIAIFGGLSVAWVVFFILAFIPWIGILFLILWIIILICVFILWIILMVKAYQGQIFKVPIVGQFAAKQVGLD
jgi:uncharacterized membrane protein